MKTTPKLPDLKVGRFLAVKRDAGQVVGKLEVGEVQSAYHSVQIGALGASPTYNR